MVICFTLCLVLLLVACKTITTELLPDVWLRQILKITLSKNYVRLFEVLQKNLTICSWIEFPRNCLKSDVKPVFEV